jgi:hypothetical protein
VRAGHSGGGRYTERGAGATKGSGKGKRRHAEDEPVLRVAGAWGLARKLPITPGKVCPHGGVYLNDTPRCGICFKQQGGCTPEDSFQLFLMSLYDVCHQIALKHHDWEKSIPREDRIHHTFVTLFGNPNSMRRIMNADNPLGMAHSIAGKRMIDLQRKPIYWKEWSVSQLNFGSKQPDGDGDDVIDNEGRLDIVRGAGYDDWYSEVQERHLVFPGVKLLWDNANLNRVRVALRNIESRLPKYPFDVAMALKLHIGYWPETGNYYFAEVAKWASENEHNLNRRVITARQAQYAIKKACAKMKADLVRLLTPASDVFKKSKR